MGYVSGNARSEMARVKIKDWDKTWSRPQACSGTTLLKNELAQGRPDNRRTTTSMSEQVSAYFGMHIVPVLAVAILTANFEQTFWGREVVDSGLKRLKCRFTCSFAFFTNSLKRNCFLILANASCSPWLGMPCAKFSGKRGVV